MRGEIPREGFGEEAMKSSLALGWRLARSEHRKSVEAARGKWSAYGSSIFWAAFVRGERERKGLGEAILVEEGDFGAEGRRIWSL